ncbi:MAG: NADPH-dependent 7-cyano-7-deazaguanine reductase QueF, partial [Rickettsia sp.]
MPLSASVLGKKSTYQDSYDATLLFKIPRINHRNKLRINSNNLPFYGVDIWNTYELSWLNNKGKPCVGVGTFYIPVTSPNIVESKSLKLYLNSFNNFIVDSMEELERIILQDLSNALQTKILGKILPINTKIEFGVPSGKNIDDLDIECNNYGPPDNSLIEYEDVLVEEEI